MRRRAHLRRREKATEPRGAMAMAIAEPLDARSRKTALIMSTVALAACFMIWTVFSILGDSIQRDFGLYEIGRASCRERVCRYVLHSVVAVSLNKSNIGISYIFNLK